MPYDANGTFTPLHSWEADYAATPPIGVSPVRFDQQDADVAAALTLLFGKLTPAGLVAVLTAFAAALPTADPLVLNQPWINGGGLFFSKGP